MSSLFDGRTAEAQSGDNKNDRDDDDDEERPAPRVAGVGASLLRSMAGKARRGLAPATSGAAAPNKQYVPSVIGGFAGSGNVSYERYALTEGSVVVRLPPASGTTSSNVATPPAAALYFKLEEDINDDDDVDRSLDFRLFGQITRMNPSSTDVEISLADGSREKVSVLELRAAGAVELRTFRKWQQNHNSSQAGGSLSGKRPRDALNPSDFPSSDTPWWVVKGIVVRVVNESLSSLCGRKYVVASASKKENRIFLGDFTESEGPAGNSRGPLAGGHTVGQQDVETVIPKDGGKALILLGEHRGEMVTVLKKVRSEETREVRGVNVTTMSGETLFVGPDQLSQFASL